MPNHLRRHHGQPGRAELPTEEVEPQVRIPRVFQVRDTTANAVLVFHVGVFELLEDALFKHLSKVIRITTT